MHEPSDVPVSAAELEQVWREHVASPAWPTFALALFVVLGELAIWVARLALGLPLWIGALAATLLAYLAFTVMHEASHGNLHGERRGLKRAGEALGWVAGMTLLAPYPAFRVLHLRHHSYTNHPDKDPDMHVAGSSLLAVLVRCATIVPHYYLSFLFGDASRSAQAKAERPAVLATTAVYAIVIALLAISGYALEVMTLWVGPAVLASAMLAFAFDWLPHHPHSGRGRMRDTRAIPGLLLEVLLLGQSLHLVHHLWPRVPFYRYGRVFRLVRPALEAQGARIETSRGEPATAPVPARGLALR